MNIIHYLRHKNKVNENKVLSYVKQNNIITHYIKLTKSFQKVDQHTGGHWFNPRHQTPQGTLSCKENVYFILSYSIYGLCVFSLPNSPAMIVRMCTLSYYHHQIGSMNH